MGWAVAAALALVVVRLRLRLELVARAEHELRGPLTAFTLALDAARAAPAGRRLSAVLDAELERARAALADLAAARSGRRAPLARERFRIDRLLRSSGAAWDEVARRSGGRRIHVRWQAGLAVARGDRGRLAQAIGNLMSNAVEHGEGDVSVSASRPAPDLLRIEVTNACAARGRGLEIAGDAAASAGGRVATAVGERRASAVLDLPVEP